jgi:hypothetical protein
MRGMIQIREWFPQLRCLISPADYLSAGLHCYGPPFFSCELCSGMIVDW